MSNYYDDDYGMHTSTLQRCQRMPHYQVIEIHIPGIQGPGGGSSGGSDGDNGNGGTTPPTGGDIATDEDIENLFPNLGGGSTEPEPDEPEQDSNIATDDDIKDLFPGL